MFILEKTQVTVADPGFPVGGGVDLVGRGVDSRGGYVLKILYVKTKELGPLGGRAPGTPPLDPPMGQDGYLLKVNSLLSV